MKRLRAKKAPLWFVLAMLASVAAISALMVFVVVATDPGLPGSDEVNDPKALIEAA